MITSTELKETSKNCKQKNLAPLIINTPTKFITIGPPVKNPKFNLNQQVTSNQTTAHVFNVQTSTSNIIFNEAITSKIAVSNSAGIYLIGSQEKSSSNNANTTSQTIQTSAPSQTILSYNLVNKPVVNSENLSSSIPASQLNVGVTQSAVNTYLVASCNGPHNNSVAMTTNINSMNIRQSAVATNIPNNSIYSTQNNNVVTNSSNHVTLINNQGTILRGGNTRHILACNVANRNQCLITTAVPMRALRIQTPNPTNRNTGVNTSQEHIGLSMPPDKPLKITTQFGNNNISKIDSTRNIVNPRSFNAVYIQNRPFIAQTIRLSNPNVARLPIRPVEIRQTTNADEIGKVFLAENAESRITSQSVVNFDHKILVSIGQNVFNCDRKIIGELISSNSDVKLLTEDNTDPVTQIVSTETKVGQQFEEGDGRGSSQNLFSDQLMSRIINQASNGEGGMIVVSQNIGQQFTALQNKGNVVSGLKLPAYIDLRQVSTNSDNSRTKTVPTKTNPCANRSKDGNARSQMNEKDSQELERVMDILKHYKQQISCHDHVTAHFLQPCKRKRSKPGESVVGAMATTSNNNLTDQLSTHPTISNDLEPVQFNYSRTFSSNHNNHSNHNSAVSISYNSNSIMASLNAGLTGGVSVNNNGGLLGASLNNGGLLGANLNGGIFGSSINANLFSLNNNNSSLLTTVNMNADSINCGDGSNVIESSDGLKSNMISPRLLLSSFRPNQVSLLQQPIGKMMFNNAEESTDKCNGSLIKNHFEMKENLPVNVNLSEHFIRDNDQVTTKKKNEEDVLDYDDNNDDNKDDVEFVCKEDGVKIVKEFIIQAFNLQSEDEIKVCIIAENKVNFDLLENKQINEEEIIKISTKKVICFVEEIDNTCCYHGSHIAENCASKTSLSLFGILFSKDLILNLEDGDLKEIVERLEGYGSIMEQDSVDNPIINLFNNSFKPCANFLISKLFAFNAEQVVSNLTDVSFSKQETLDDQNCFILAINNKLEKVQYLTIPDYIFINDEKNTDNCIKSEGEEEVIDISESSCNTADKFKTVSDTIKTEMHPVTELCVEGMDNNDVSKDDTDVKDTSNVREVEGDILFSSSDNKKIALTNKINTRASKYANKEDKTTVQSKKLKSSDTAATNTVTAVRTNIGGGELKLTNNISGGDLKLNIDAGSMINRIRTRAVAKAVSSSKVIEGVVKFDEVKTRSQEKK